MSANSSQLVRAGYNTALMQTIQCRPVEPRGIRGGPLLYRDHVNMSRCKRNSCLFELSSTDSRHGAQLGVLHWRSSCISKSRVNSSRKDYGNISSLERLVRRTVKSEEEQEEKVEAIKEEQSKLVATTPKHTQLETFVATAQGVIMTARIFTSMMTWVILFFMASIWDGDSESFKDRGKKNGKRGPRR